MFGVEDFKCLVEFAGRALEDEDRLLAAGWRWRKKPIGIRVNANERYYQFVIWRQLMRSFRWRAETEDERHDLAFYDDETEQPVAFAEIKGWWGTTGEAELPGIRADVNKLDSGLPGVMLILTSNRKEQTDKNLDFLAKELGVNRHDLATYRFDIAPWRDDEDHAHEFVIIGLLVAQKASTAAV